MTQVLGGQLSEVKNWQKLPIHSFKKIYQFKINLVKGLFGGGQKGTSNMVYQSQRDAEIEFLRNSMSEEDFEQLDLRRI